MLQLNCGRTTFFRERQSITKFISGYRYQKLFHQIFSIIIVPRARNLQFQFRWPELFRPTPETTSYLISLPPSILRNGYFPGQILSHLFSWNSLERFSLFCGQRKKRIDLVLRQPQHPADLAIRGTELVTEFPGEIKSLRFGQVFNRGDIVI